MKKQKVQIREHQKLWSIQEAQANLSQVIDAASLHGYQTITRNGEPVAVIISKEDFDKTTTQEQSFIEFFKAAPCPEVDLDIQRS